MAQPEGIGLDRFNALAPAEAAAALTACCTSPRWAHELAAGRPYGSAEELYGAAARVLATLDEGEVDAALAGHPRIGERPGGSEGEWSRREQSGVAGADAGVLAALAEGNRAYEERFGHVYLVAATGRSAEELLAILRRRLDNDAATERGVVRRELGAIIRIRLARMIGA